MKPLVLIAALAVVAAPVAAAQQSAKPTQFELKQADQTLSLIVSAINSKDIPQDMKNGLFGCLYENPLKKIAGGAAEILLKDKSIDPKDQNQRLLVIAKVCGLPAPASAKKSG